MNQAPELTGDRRVDRALANLVRLVAEIARNERPADERPATAGAGEGRRSPERLRPPEVPEEAA